MKQLTRTLALLLLLSLLALTVGVTIGSVSISAGELWAVLKGDGSPLHRTLLLDLRMPRALSAFAVGGLLAVAGALMQILLRNPLADPYVLGLSGGAAVGALSAMLAGLGGTLVAGAAFGGALASTMIVFGVAHGSGSWTTTRLLLTGVVVAAGWGALISFMLAVSPTAELPGMLFWLMGDMSHARSPLLPMALLLLVVVGITLPFGRTLNILAQGPQQAAALGVSVRRTEWMLHLTAALLSAVAVTVAGSIGFVGLIVPHMLRLLIGNDQRVLLPASALAGGTLLVLDTLARTMIAPEQLPVGVITALLGVPVFLYLLRRGQP